MMHRFRRWLLAPIIVEIMKMRASTVHLTEAIGLLAASLTASNQQINDELTALLALKNVDDSDPDVEAQVQKIRDLVTANDAAVATAKAALTTVPPDTGVPGAAPVDPAALPPDTATNTTGRDPASGAPAGQGAVGAGQS